MKKFIADVANWCADHGPFVVTILSIFVATHLAFWKDADINTILPTILGLYLGSKATTSVSSHWAASKDDTCDTAKVIQEVEGLSRPVQAQKDEP